MDRDGDAIPALPLVLVAAYVGAQLIADVASLKIGSVFGLAVDLGAFIYPFTFTLRDMVHRATGTKATRAVILSAAAINLAMAAYFWLAGRLPGHPDAVHAEAFRTVFAPVWRIVLASIAAEVASELVDTEIYRFVRARAPERLWLRVLASNAVSMPLDNLVFVVGAFAGRLPWSAMGEIFLVNLAVKFAVMLISIPGIYALPAKLDKV
ncbi:MAG: queuosine precursor transporter [Kiritimatiellia bacterium]|jgi:uncharacterized integral membrane protein (TIGR00697 family)